MNGLEVEWLITVLAPRDEAAGAMGNVEGP